MELPPIKSRILSVRVEPIIKDQCPFQSRDNIKTTGISVELYRLNGNRHAVKMNNYCRLMRHYMDSFSGQSLIKNTKKDLALRKYTREYSTPSPLAANFYRKQKGVHNSFN
ncbi:hypothetical protein SteCoe_4767 [Stentor coeruleus]|uniref:Uncharacterized protein n=1 Tax=Stentor coeruleus TaxID=5963 RepID=A0A1R2CTY8_9CILI|nr:hypothetical protein SteCoe_4767 [Stentor coeruleus]